LIFFKVVNFIIDLVSGYWQLEISEKDREKTAFITPMGVYEFNVLPFGLKAAPSFFMRAMSEVFRGLIRKIMLIYLDDLIIPANSFEQTLERLRIVFERLRLNNLKLKPSKCKLFRKSVPFLGHVISSEGIKMDNEKIEKVLNWEIPRKGDDIKSFLGLCSYYRKFIAGFSKLAQPLYAASMVEAKNFIWTKNLDECFTKLKIALTNNKICCHCIILITIK